MTFASQEPCVFCRIVSGEIPARKVYEDDKVLAFHDVNPQAPVHVLVIPRQHIVSLSDLSEEESGLLLCIHRAILKLAREFASGSSSGYRVVVNKGASAGQSVFHLHYHFLAGRSFNWPPG